MGQCTMCNGDTTIENVVQLPDGQMAGLCGRCWQYVHALAMVGKCDWKQEENRKKGEQTAGSLQTLSIEELRSMLEEEK